MHEVVDTPWLLFLLLSRNRQNHNGPRARTTPISLTIVYGKKPIFRSEIHYQGARIVQ
jgi:hypothetical protein